MLPPTPHLSRGPEGGSKEVSSTANLTFRVKLVEGSLPNATSRDHRVTMTRRLIRGTDPRFLGGEMMLAGEGGCSPRNLMFAARVRGIVMHHADVPGHSVQMESPPGFAEVILIVNSEAEACDEEISKLLTIAQRSCTVSNTFARAPCFLCGEPTAARGDVAES